MNLQSLNGGSVGLLVIGPWPEVGLLAWALHDEIGPGHGCADDVDGDADVCRRRLDALNGQEASLAHLEAAVGAIARQKDSSVFLVHPEQRRRRTSGGQTLEGDGFAERDDRLGSRPHGDDRSLVDLELRNGRDGADGAGQRAGVGSGLRRVDVSEAEAFPGHDLVVGKVEKETVRWKSGTYPGPPGLRCRVAVTDAVKKDVFSGNNRRIRFRSPDEKRGP